MTETEAKKLAKDLSFYDVIETSALTQNNLKEVFDEAIMASLKRKENQGKTSCWKSSLTSRLQLCYSLKKHKADPNSTKSHSVLFSEKADQNSIKSLCVLRPNFTGTG